MRCVFFCSPINIICGWNWHSFISWPRNSHIHFMICYWFTRNSIVTISVSLQQSHTAKLTCSLQIQINMYDHVQVFRLLHFQLWRKVVWKRSLLRNITLRFLHKWNNNDVRDNTFIPDCTPAGWIWRVGGWNPAVALHVLITLCWGIMHVWMCIPYHVIYQHNQRIYGGMN